MFLRQSIMWGGIPFSLTVPEKYVTSTEILENAEFVGAFKRYKSINGQNDFDITKIEPLIRAVETFLMERYPEILLSGKTYPILESIEKYL